MDRRQAHVCAQMVTLTRREDYTSALMYACDKSPTRLSHLRSGLSYAQGGKQRGRHEGLMDVHGELWLQAHVHILGCGAWKYFSEDLLSGTVPDTNAIGYHRKYQGTLSCGGGLTGKVLLHDPTPHLHKFCARASPLGTWDTYTVRFVCVVCVCRVVLCTKLMARSRRWC